jgi:hypothetical protein
MISGTPRPAIRTAIAVLTRGRVLGCGVVDGIGCLLC